MTQPALRRARLRAAVAAILTLLLGALALQLAPAATAATKLVLGQANSLTFSASSQIKDFSYAATAGDKLVLDVSKADLTWSSPWGHGILISLIRPDGSELDGAGGIEPVGKHVLPVLDVTGSWTVRLFSVGDTYGKVSFGAYKAVDTVTPVTPGTATTVTYKTGTGGVRLTFPVTAGKRLTLAVTNPNLTFPSGGGTVRGYAISPTGVTTTYDFDFTAKGFLEPPATLTETGTWTLLLNPIGTLGTEKVTVGLVSDPSAAVTVGSTFTVGTSVPGQNSSYTFPGTAGQQLQLYVDNPSFTAGGSGGSTQIPGANLSLYGPDGSVQLISVGAGGDHSEQTLDWTGTYTLQVNPISDSVGSESVTLKYQTITTAALVQGASTTTSLPRGDLRRFTFTGYVGRQLGVQLTALSTPASAGLDVVLKRPDGSIFWMPSTDVSPFVITGPRYFETPELDVAGKWTLELSGFSHQATPGSATFTARWPADLAGGTLTAGASPTAKVGTPTTRVRYTFTGAVGQHPTIAAAPGTWKTSDGAAASAEFVFLRPDGTRATIVTRDVNADGSAWLGGPRLDVAGQWTLLVDPYADAVGAQKFTFGLVNDVTGTLTLGKQQTVKITQRAAEGRYTFSWNGQGSLKWVADNGMTADLALLAPDGSGVAAGIVQDGSTTGTFTPGAPQSGTWTLLVDPTNSGTGTLKITVSKA